MINLRNALMAGKKWKNPYVTDGLVAMWDGEWNVGGGIHDPNAMIWKDLVGNYDLTISSNGSFESNALSTSGGGRAAYYSTTIKNIKSIEISLKHTSGNCVFWNGVGCHLLYWTSAVSGSNGYEMCSMSDNNFTGFVSQRESNGSTFAFIFSKASTSTQNHLVSAYVNAAAKTLSAFNNQWSQDYDTFKIGSLRNDNWLASKCKIHSFRAYSRALTADEIAANYAIDKARFNLPDAT